MPTDVNDVLGGYVQYMTRPFNYIMSGVRMMSEFM